MKTLKKFSKYALILFALVFLFELGRGTAYNISRWYNKPRGEELKRYLDKTATENNLFKSN